MNDISKKKLDQIQKPGGIQIKPIQRKSTDLFKDMQVSQMVQASQIGPRPVFNPNLNGGSPEKDSPYGYGQSPGRSPGNGISPELGGNVLNLSGDMLNTVYLNKKYPITREVVCLKEGALPDNMVPKTAYEKLMIPGIFIKQKVEIFEVLAGCEMENKYKLYSCDYEGNQVGASLFEAREKSNVCARWCLSYSLYGFIGD